jgi:hypothetical protein
MVQSCHAAVEAARFFLPPHEQHPHIIICGVANERSLWGSLHKLQQRGLRFRAFREPDLGNRLTALATEPVFDETRRLFRNLSLLTPTPSEEER